MTATEFEDNVIESCNATKYRTISPGLCGTCSDCQSAYGMEPREFYAAVSDGSVSDEGGFSWQVCECCNSDLGGDRYAAHALADDNGILHFNVCVDCIMYLENGDLPNDD